MARMRVNLENLVEVLYNNNDDERYDASYEETPPDPSKFPPKNFYNFCSEENMNFLRAGPSIKKIVFWFTVPMIALNFCFLIIMLCYQCPRYKKFIRANFVTKIQFILLYILVVCQTLELVLYNITTRNFMFGAPQPNFDKQPGAFAEFLFADCARGARLIYGTTGYLVMMSTFFMGYR